MHRSVWKVEKRLFTAKVSSIWIDLVSQIAEVLRTRAGVCSIVINIFEIYLEFIECRIY